MSSSEHKVMILIYGPSGQGKTYCARQLERENGFKMISVDEEYVSFIRTQFTELFFDRLGHFIGQHYDHILIPGVKNRVLDPKILQEWRKHLAGRIASELPQGRVVAEGYLLKDLLGDLRSEFESLCTLRIVEAREKKYYLAQREISIADIATD